MARIRTVKPSFFRHGELQDLEGANPGKHCMLVFEGLWGHCDRTGVFEYNPRQLKLDILPFLKFEMAETLGLLERAGFLRRYEVNGKQYAVIPSFPEHQRISGKESQEPLKYPREAEGKQKGSRGEALENKQGSVGETSGKHLPVQEVEGNGVQEGNGITAGQEPSAPSPAAVELIPLQDGTDFPVTADFVAELDRAYPAVDIPQTLREIRAWNLSNPGKRKTLRGVRKHIHTWVAGEQQKAGAH